MELRKLLGDEEAVSPVIGVTLLVAITVILAAVVVLFLLGAGTTKQVPQAAFEFEFESNETFDPPNTNVNAATIGSGETYVSDQLRITHGSGDAIASDNLEIRVKGGGVKYIDDQNRLQDFGSGFYHSEFTFEDMGIRTEVSAGDTVTLVNIYEDYVASTGPYNPEEMLRSTAVYVVWDGTEGSSSILTRWNGPKEGS